MDGAVSFSSSEPLGWPAPAPVLVVADTDAAYRRAARALDAGGLPPSIWVPLAGAVERLSQQARLGVLWIEVEHGEGEQLDTLLRRVDEEVRDGRYSAVISIPAELIDLVSAAVSCSDIELLVNAGEAERAAALALALADLGPSGVRDAASDGSAAKLRQLSEEVSRIATSLARLSDEPPVVKPVMQAPPTGDLPQVPAETVRAMIRARRLRSKYLPGDLFADPAWDMLLDLLQAELVQHRVPVSSLCMAAAVPATTALRWIKSMTDRGLLLRRADPHDGRRIFIEMAGPTSRAMRSFFADVGGALV